MKNKIINFKRKARIRTRLTAYMAQARAIPKIYKANGVKGVIKAFAVVYSRRFNKVEDKSLAGDVLIISINEPLLDRYRTDHMIEGLESTGLSVGKIFYYEMKPEHVKRFNTFIFYRCPWLDSFEDIFEQIKSKNKVSVYAVDDLVIDKKYTDTLPTLQSLTKAEKELYDDGVDRHNRLMKNCDYAITTTNDLSKELSKYTNLKEVYVDRNSMSDEMVYHSNNAVKGIERPKDRVILGYFSGTNTHNEDFQMIAPVLVKLLNKYDNLFIKLAGRVDAPDSLKGYEDRMIYTPYVDWRDLPKELVKADINLSPLVDTLFNRSKSEIKWAESALVGVPVVASDIGAFSDSIEHGVTGMLAKNTEESWEENLVKLIEDDKLRNAIGEASRSHVLTNYRATGHRAIELANFLNSITPNVVAFAGVNISAISGGNMVVKKHMDILRDAGNIIYGIETMDYSNGDGWDKLGDIDDEKYDIFRINSNRPRDFVDLKMSFDRLVATFWASVDTVDSYRYIKPGGKKLYLVQGMEAGFYRDNDPVRRKVLATYSNHRIEPVTISKWCQGWLKNDFKRVVKYSPNGIDLGNFNFLQRNIKGRKIKILIEGDNSSKNKRVDESFRIANKLDRDRYEVSYLSYKAHPKEWYLVDKVYMEIPHKEVGDIYALHDILIKSSILESFSYPPLEMMATGGVAIIAPNDGNVEYVEDGVNAIYYKPGDIDDALKKIELLSKDEGSFKRIAKSGRETAMTRSWNNIKSEIKNIYE